MSDRRPPDERPASGSTGHAGANDASEPADIGPMASREGVPDLVVLGNLLIDDVVFPDGRTLMAEPGGACLYLSLAASLWGARVAVVSVRGVDYPAEGIAAMERHGIDLSGVRVLDGPGLRTWLLYEKNGRRVVHHAGLPDHRDVSPVRRDIPTHCLEARAFHISPMPFDRQRQLVEALAPRREAGLSLDPHQPVTEKNLGAWLEVLGRIDAFFVSEDELRLDGLDENPRTALRRLAGGRLRFVAFKRSRRGGLLYDAKDGSVLEWPPVPRLTGDPTGSGDAFAGGFLASVLEGGTVQDALDQATIAVSFSLEEWGARGLMQATRSEANRRRREWLGSIG